MLEGRRKLESGWHRNTLRNVLPTTFNSEWFVGSGSARRVLP